MLMKKVAVINSDPDFRHLVKSYLERKGYAALSINVDEPVLPRLREHLPDVIVLDVTAEQHARICEQLRSDERIQHARLVVLSEHPTQKLPPGCTPDEVLLKPFSPQDLLEKIGRLI
jgi:DNA-binding response OmpR family regulator